MARYECNRCHADLNTTDADRSGVGHLCKDLKKRYERQAKAVKAITEILNPYLLGYSDDDLPYRASPEEVEGICLEIIKKISGLNLEDS